MSQVKKTDDISEQVLDRKKLLDEAKNACCALTAELELIKKFQEK